MPSKNPALLSIFAPASDGYVVRTHGAECADESTGQTGIGQQWNIQVYGSAADTSSPAVRFFGIFTTMSISFLCSISSA